MLKQDQATQCAPKEFGRMWPLRLPERSGAFAEQAKHFGTHPNFGTLAIFQDVHQVVPFLR